MTVASHTITDPVTTAVLDEAVALSGSAADFRFTELEDRVRDSGWSITLPLRGQSRIEIKGGGGHSEKARTYKQSQFGLGPLSVGNVSALAGPIDEVFSEANILDTSNNFVFARNGTNNQSYLAATMTDALLERRQLHRHLVQERARQPDRILRVPGQRYDDRRPMVSSSRSTRWT